MAEGQPQTAPPTAVFTFTKHQVEDYDIPYETHIANRQDAKIQYSFVANGAIVIDSHQGTSSHSNGSLSTASPPQPSEPKVLLIQRAMHDSMPGLWEIPGGACDPEDPSILHSVARELWEEAGLKAARIGPLVGGTDYLFLTSTGNLVCKFTFLVDVERNGPGPGGGGKGGGRALEVKLDPREHQAYVWATEREVEIGWVGDIELRFTGKQLLNAVLEGFKLQREMDALDDRQGGDAVP